MNWGAAIGFGLPISVALWLVTDNVAFIAVGVILGIAVGSAMGGDEKAVDDDDVDQP